MTNNEAQRANEVCNNYEQQIATAERKLKELRNSREALVKAIIADLRLWWTFDGRQQHTHTWHDREVFIEELGRAMDGKLTVLGNVCAALAERIQKESGHA